MTIEMLREILGWCIVINTGLLLWWFMFLVFAHDLVYRLHSKWFEIPVETFNTIHYSGLAGLKIVVFVFNITPYIALCIVM